MFEVLSGSLNMVILLRGSIYISSKLVYHCVRLWRTGFGRRLVLVAIVLWLVCHVFRVLIVRLDSIWFFGFVGGVGIIVRLTANISLVIVVWLRELFS